jgi:hypothetical protein
MTRPSCSADRRGSVANVARDRRRAVEKSAFVATAVEVAIRPIAVSTWAASARIDAVMRGTE